MVLFWRCVSAMFFTPRVPWHQTDFHNLLKQEASFKPKRFAESGDLVVAWAVDLDV